MVTSDEIVSRVFTKVFRGYDVQEVDLFLDEVIRTLEEHEQQRDVLLSRIEGLLQELDRCDALIAQNGLRPARSQGAGEPAAPSQDDSPEDSLPPQSVLPPEERPEPV